MNVITGSQKNLTQENFILPLPSSKESPIKIEEFIDSNIKLSSIPMTPLFEDIQP